MSTQSVFKTPAGEQAVMAWYDDVLAHWPVPNAVSNVETRHGRTFVIASGDESAPPLVLLHGSATNSAIWIGDVAEFSRRYRVYCVDLLGEAGKSAQNRLSWEGPAYAEWLEDVFAALNIGRASLVGASLGGWAAMKFAVRCPERVEKLVLMTPGGVVPARSSFLVMSIPLTLLGKWGIKRINRILFADEPIPEGVEDILVLVSSNFKPRLAVIPPFTDDELRRLTMPVLHLGGAKDALCDQEKVAARLQALLPTLTVTIIPGAGHALLNTTAHVMRFLGR